MRTIPLPERVPPGTLAFGNNLLVRFKEDNTFWVYNGAWEGMFDGELIYIVETNEYVRVSEPFEEVIDLTDDERDQWYMPHSIYINPADEPEDDEIPF